ncbi:UPF0182 family protein [soil metagenome]
MHTRSSARPFPIVDWLQRRTRAQWVLAIVVVALYLLYRAARLGATVLLDRWWFDSVTDAPVWSVMTTAKLQLALAAGLITAATIGVSVRAVLRSRPIDDAPLSPPVRWYGRRMGPAHRWLLIIITLFVTERIAVAAMDEWQTWLLFRHGPSLGVDVPELGGDLGDHLFRLPFLAAVSAWLRSLVIAAAAISLFGHIVSGAIHLPLRGRRSSAPALAHLAMLGMAFAAFSALDYVLVRRPSLATSRAGAFDGPGFVELRVIAPAMWVLAVVAIATGFALVLASRTGRWRASLTIVGLWAMLHLLLLAAVPAAVQKYLVTPAEGARQLPYIEHNLDATKTAYGLDDVEVERASVVDGLTGDLDADSVADVERVPLFTAEQLVEPLQVLQGTTGNRITRVHLDRYEIDGVRRPVMLAARHASRGDLPEQGWVQRHLVYTHGDGIVTVPADAPANDGRPDTSEFEGPELMPRRPQLYFGEGLEDWYAIVNTRREETGGTRFEGSTGIKLDSWFSRLALSVAESETEPLFSSELTGESQLLYRRGVVERLEAVAPFLRFDSDPYPVITEDRLVWVVDGYTTSARYPYSQFASRAGLPDSSGLARGGFNYLKASVRATVDGYDGTVHLYRTAEDGEDPANAADPILSAWIDIFPGLIEPMSSMPDEITGHLRYPIDLMTVQTTLLGRYHVDSPETLFNGTDKWSIAPAASSGVGQQGEGASPAVWMFLPGGGDSGGDWVSIRPYGPGDATNAASVRNELAALAIGNHDSPTRLRLVAFDRDAGRQLATPLVAQSAIDADPELARVFEGLNNVDGSRVQFGPMTPVLVDGGLAWVRPIIVTGTAATTAPRLYGVAAVSDGLVGIGDDVASALDAAQSGSPGG